jgi:hypothetical protein
MDKQGKTLLFKVLVIVVCNHLAVLAALVVIL